MTRKVRIILSILLLVFSTRTVFGLDYTIKEVIEVGEADFVPFIDPLRWSPDGTKLAFTKNGVIKISDTLGNLRDVFRPDMQIHRWEWVSNVEIALYLRSFTGKGGNTVNRLSLANVDLITVKSVHSFETFYGYRDVAGHSISMGPFKTVEGNTYFVQTIYSGNRGESEQAYISFDQGKTESIVNDHFVRWSDSGLYMVELTGEDSIWLAQKPYQQMSLNPIVSSELNFAFDRRILFKLKDNLYFSINSLFDTLPANTIQCGAVWASFNPVAPELLFTISCDDGENYVTNRIATLDCQTMQLKVIDTDLNISNCAAATFAPDGRKIAFLANHKVYVLKREIK